MGKIYVVFVGRVPSFYTTWEVCKVEVSGFPGAVYCKFDDKREALAAHSKFIEDRNWCSQNPVYICPSCQRCIEFQISNSRATIGSHYYSCKTAGCSHFAWVTDERMKDQHPEPHNVEDKACSSSSSSCDLKYEALQAELRAVRQERDSAVGICNLYKDLMHEFVNLKLEDN